MSDTKLNRGTIEGILASPDVKDQEVDVPEWDCSVKVKGLTKREQLEIRELSTHEGSMFPNQTEVEVHTFLKGVVEPKFELAHYGRILDKSSGAVDRVLGVILELSGMKPETKEKAKEHFPEAS